MTSHRYYCQAFRHLGAPADSSVHHALTGPSGVSMAGELNSALLAGQINDILARRLEQRERMATGVAEAAWDKWEACRQALPAWSPSPSFFKNPRGFAVFTPSEEVKCDDYE